VTSDQAVLPTQLHVVCCGAGHSRCMMPCVQSRCALVARQDGGPTVTSWHGPRELLFDYYGFPPESYKFKYPSPGSPQLAQRIVSLFKWVHTPYQCARSAGPCKCNM
jgi:hypothetical protein